MPASCCMRLMRFRESGLAHFDLCLNVAGAELARCAAEQAHRAFFDCKTVRRGGHILLELRVFGAEITHLAGV